MDCSYIINSIALVSAIVFLYLTLITYTFLHLIVSTVVGTTIDSIVRGIGNFCNYHIITATACWSILSVAAVCNMITCLSSLFPMRTLEESRD